MFGLQGGFFGGGDGGGGFFGGGVPGRFDHQYHCFPLSFIGKEDLEKGNKIILPQSALDHLARLNISYPMLFEIANPGLNRRTHGGVQEFSAEEGNCYLPYWLMSNLLLSEGDLIRVCNTSLPKGTYVKLQPCSKDFLDIHNPRAVLENTLRNFATLTVGDCICINYNSRMHEIEIIEARPANAISIIEADVNVDFAPPKDYVEPPRPGAVERSAPALVTRTEESSEPAPEEPGFKAFEGAGQRVDGKAIKASPSLGPAAPPQDDDDEQPWKKRIPKGIKYMEKPFGAGMSHQTGIQSR